MAVPAYGPGLDPGAVAELVEAAEALGFDSAWFPDHVAVPDYAAGTALSPPFLEPLSAIAHSLGRTRRLVLGTDVLVAPYRHPLLVAAMAGTLAALAPDRLVLGVGVGYLKGEFEVLGAGPYQDRGRVTEEFLATLRRPPSGYHVMAGPRPVPVWVGGNSAAARDRAARLGDGWHPLWMPPGDYAAARADLTARRAAAGCAGPFTFSYSAPATRLLDSDPGEWPAPRAAAAPGTEFAYAPAPWLAPDGRPRLQGTPDQVAADLALLARAGVEHVTLRFGTTDPGPLARFAAEVRPAVRAGDQ